jgi:hypothetical protein
MFQYGYRFWQLRGSLSMKYFAKFLLLVVALICLGSFSPRAASAHANPLPAASSAAERHNPASAHDRRTHRSSHRRHRHHRTHS